MEGIMKQLYERVAILHHVIEVEPAKSWSSQPPTIWHGGGYPDMNEDDERLRVIRDLLYSVYNSIGLA